MSSRTFARRLRTVTSACGAAAIAALGLAGAGPAEAAHLPAVQINYTGKMSVEVFPTAGKPSHQLRTLAWNAGRPFAPSPPG